ncbi:hypothetical protein GH714_018741 [Hevea brasiliensis]|uniref:Uncharacterized protein n=1 Tax=Hevea brasiliensis TaxID=3981 RepID=A0A6A6LYG4_HEVBR|nr:hypothetical protein GH714_018741 [Hevea brasiliensis]
MVGFLCACARLGALELGDWGSNLMDRNEFLANPVLGTALIDMLHRDTQLAEHVLKQLIALEPWNSGNYVLLSNIYSSSHKWDDAAKIRSIMNDKGIQKIPGCSWIEVDGIVHEFLIGDKSHPLSESIYAKLGELDKDLKAAGYVPKTDNVLFDIEEEEKNISLVVTVRSWL